MEKELVIVGAGPAGLTAAIYACRARLDVLVIESLAAGGQVLTTEKVENYPGFPEGISGFELSSLMEQQAKKFGMEMLNASVTEIKQLDDGKLLVKADKQDITTKTVIFATGATPRKLKIPGELELTGRGVSYCATCDGAFFRERVVYVIGGGDSAVEEGLFLTRFASKVYLVHRRDQLRASKILQERAFENPKIEILWNTVPVKIEGENKVVKIHLKDVKTKEIRTEPADGVFFYVGLIPNSCILESLVKLDDNNFIITDENCYTGTPGIYAVGDIRHKSLRQIVNAAADGAIAADAVNKYLEEL